MSGAEGVQRSSPDMHLSTERGSNRPFTLSVATFNVGNGKRGPGALHTALNRMTELSLGGPGIIGFQEIPPRSAVELNLQLPEHWGMRHFINPTDPQLSMGVAFDVSQLDLVQSVEQFSHEPISSWHRHIEFPKREVPLQRETQLLHFTLKEDPSVHIVVANAHLSVRGHGVQRQKEMDEVMVRLGSFMQKEGLVDEATDMVVPGVSLAVYVLGDFNTPGRVGSVRNKRETERLQLFEQGFTKLNDWLDPTSNVLSSILHKAHDVLGDSALKTAAHIGKRARRGLRTQKLFSAIVDLSQQHRDHIFSKLYGLKRQENLENKVFGLPHHPIESDHFMVFTGSVLAKTS